MVTLYWAPVALGACIVLVATPLTDVAWLATSAVRDLTLCSLYTHCLEGATNFVKGTFRAVMTFGALAYGGIGHSVEASIAEIACHALCSLNTSSTVVCLWTIAADVLISASRILVGLFVHTGWTKRLSLDTQVAL